MVLDSTFSLNDLPNEVLILILRHIASPKHIAVIPLLFVCRRFHGISIPILYEDIERKVNGRDNWKIFASIQTSPYLSITKRFTLVIALLRDPIPALPRILSSMTNLKWLYLDITRPEPTILNSIHSSALTHLTFMGTLHPSALRDGLSAQTSIKYLRFWCYSGCMDLPANALPNLRFLHSSTSFWSEFTSGRSIQHLQGPSMKKDLPSLDFLQPVKSLKLETASVTHMRVLIRHLKSVEFLWLTVEDPETLAIRGIAPPTLEDYLAIPSQNLQYCNVGRSSFSIEDSDRMFGEFPHLKAVDICSSSNCEPMVVTRFIRDASSPVVTVIPTPKKWEQWWEIIRRDLEA